MCPYFYIEGDNVADSRAVSALQRFHEMTSDVFPVAIYLVSPEGVILASNTELRKLLRIPADEEIATVNLRGFYRDPDDRDRMLDVVAQAENIGKLPARQIVDFQIGEDPITVQIDCRPLRDSESGELLGYTGYMIDVTLEENSRKLLNLLSEGVFEVDEGSIVQSSNYATARLFGGAIEGMDVRALFSLAPNAPALEDIVRENGSAKDVWEMCSLAGERFFAEINAAVLLNSTGEFAGYQATIRDVSVTEQYRKMLNDAPLGFYMVSTRNGEDTVSNCNRKFANIFGFKSESDVIGMRMRNLHGEAKNYEKFLTKLRHENSEGNPLLGHKIHIKTHDGRKFFIEVNAQLLHNHSGEIIGRVGVVRDLSDEIPAALQVKEMTNDIGHILHTYSATLQMIQISVDPALSAYRRDLELPQQISADDAEHRLSREALHLADSIAALKVYVKGSAEHIKAVSEQNLNELTRLQALLLNYETEVQTPEFRPPVLLEIASSVRGVCRNIKKGAIAREMTRRVASDALILEQLCCVIALNRVEQTIFEMDYEVRSLRDYITQAERTDEERISDVAVPDLIRQSIANVVDYARKRNVEVRRKLPFPAVSVRAAERDMIRAITNVVHNAIKYSWIRDSGENSWVEVRADVTGKEIRIEIEDYGVPIHADEIEDKIFKFGARGRFASNRRRIGTGVGLTDSKRVIERFRGKIRIFSRPTRATTREIQYNQPFLTTAVITLPISRYNR